MNIFLAAIFGAIIGSFLSVVISRLHKGEKGIIAGRSHCQHCKTPLKAKNLIPIFSWLAQKGRCSACHKPISVTYPLLEISTALVFALTINHFGLEITTLLYLALFTLYIAIFFYDLLYMEIPDRFSLTAIVIAILISLTIKTPAISDALWGGAIGLGFFLAQFLISQGRWIGGGDLRLGALIGLSLGIKGTLVALFSAYMLGAIYASFLLISGKAAKNHQLPFGPFLIAGFAISLIWSQEIIDWYWNIM